MRMYVTRIQRDTSEYQLRPASIFAGRKSAISAGRSGAAAELSDDPSARSPARNGACPLFRCRSLKSFDNDMCLDGQTFGGSGMCGQQRRAGRRKGRWERQSSAVGVWQVGRASSVVGVGQMGRASSAVGVGQVGRSRNFVVFVAIAMRINQVFL